VASLYYQQNLTQQEIGDRLGLSRIKINRLLKLAVSSGIVQVTINASRHGQDGRTGRRAVPVALDQQKYRHSPRP
jgi:DNA-binding transcriptional regulator LsrR (DeoR family)